MSGNSYGTYSMATIPHIKSAPYHVDLLKDMDQGQDLSSEAVAELHHTTDLVLQATKQAAATIGRLTVAMERHLWVNLDSIRKKEKGFILDVLVLPSELFVNPLRRWSASSERQRSVQPHLKPIYHAGQSLVRSERSDPVSM